MNSLIHADIFFFVTTIVTIVVGILVVVALWFVIKTLRNVSTMSDILRRESEILADDISVIRAKMRENAFSLKSILGFIGVLLGKSPKKQTHEK